MLQLQLAKRYFDMYGVLITVSSRQNGKIYRSQISASGFHIGILGPQVFPVHGWLIFQKRCLAKSRDFFFFVFIDTLASFGSGLDNSSAFSNDDDN